MQKVSKTKREMFNAFNKKYKNVPEIFVMRTLDYAANFGNCFDVIEDYKPHAIQEFNSEKSIWLNKKL